MPPPISFWDRPGVNRFLPTVQALDDEPDASEFVNHPQATFDGAPPPRYDPQPQLEAMPLQGPDLIAALGDYLRRRGARPVPPVRQAGYLPYLRQVIQGPPVNAALQAQAIEPR